ncbi:MAG: carboxypeptidase regulatory-like domain-containing protein [Bryobacterales bacterium]|nr:carboxypeptidase regulatory-like domain-containing protein [Bryobacterales bacterium]
MGTVIEDSGEERWGTRPARMVVDEVFHGLVKETREVEVDTHAGSSCNMPLRKGERYMIYGSPVAGRAGVVQRNACSFSFAVRGNERLLAALRNAERGEGGELAGAVRVKTEQYRVDSEGAAGVRVVAVAGETRLETVTDSGGAFSFQGVPPGKYHLELVTENYRVDDWRWPMGDVGVSATGCGLGPRMRRECMPLGEYRRESSWWA